MMSYYDYSRRVGEFVVDWLADDWLRQEMLGTFPDFGFQQLTSVTDRDDVISVESVSF